MLVKKKQEADLKAVKIKRKLKNKYEEDYFHMNVIIYNTIALIILLIIIGLIIYGVYYWLNG